ncbi:hypothetical protein SRABI106_03534 [Rahnella aquatilis]|nr:hypothetical protein SRABI106_03534 [Rahnella aquatilis]
MLTRIDHTTDTDGVAHFEARDFRANLFHASDNFMPRNHRINALMPFITRLVDVRVANTAVQNVDHNVGITRVTANKIMRRKRRIR